MVSELMLLRYFSNRVLQSEARASSLSVLMALMVA